MTGAAVLSVAVAMGAAITQPAGEKLAIATASGVLLAAIALRAPHRTVYALAIWLVVLGMLRRVTTGAGDGLLTADPLLGVAPLLFAVLGLSAVRAGALRHRTGLTTSAGGLIAVLGLSALNPTQGAVVGLTGLGIVVSPMLAFFISRALLTTREVTRVLVLVAALAVPAAVYGLFQLFARFPQWDQRWIENKGYVALNLGNDVVRPFGSFASGQEFGTYVAVGLVIVVAFSGRLRRLVAAPVMALLAAAVWYESGRSILVLLVVALSLMAAAKACLSLPRALVLGAAMLVALPWAVGQLAPGDFGDGAAGTAGERNVEGLADPLGEGSTLYGHVDGLVRGVRSAFTEPLGQGVGAVTSAAGALGGSSAGTESDPGNASVAAGLPALVLYLAVTMRGFARTYRLAARTREPLALAALGILAVTFLHWLSGGMYAVAWIPWLVLGWVDGAAEASRSDGTGEHRREASVV